MTGSKGRFRMLGLAAGSYVVIAHRIGYTPVTTTQQFAAGDTLRLTLTLERNIAQLDTVAVVATHRSSRLTEFEDRRRTGTGQSMTAADMEKRNAVVVKDLLRTFPGVTIVNDAVAVNRRVQASRSCPFKFFIDGVSIRTPGLDDLPSLQQLAGIEVFTSIASVPLQYKSYDGGGFCGVILLWTKDGSGPD